MPLRPLDGFAVGMTADGRRDEQADLLRRRGASVVEGPALTVRSQVDGALRRQTEDLIRHPPDLLVVSTATGMTMWFDAAERWGLRTSLTAALSTAFIAARGEKAADATNASELTVWWQPPSEANAELIAHLRGQGLGGKRIAVQLDGSGSPGLVEALGADGADVVELVAYVVEEPADDVPAIAMIEAASEGRLDAITFTSATAIENLFAIAERRGLGDSLRKAFEARVVCACIGPVSAEAARRAAVTEPLVPPRARLGSLVQSIAARLSAGRRDLMLRGRPVTVQGTLAIVDGETVTMSGRERAVFDALARRPGAVIPKARLALQVWGSPGSTRAVDTTVSRLRRRLGVAGGAVRTTRNRGYWLDAVPVDAPSARDVSHSVSGS
jgi:uroporphyrinogen-III synthase